jgi:hypothetical protein
MDSKLQIVASNAGQWPAFWFLGALSFVKLSRFCEVPGAKWDCPLLPDGF